MSRPAGFPFRAEHIGSLLRSKDLTAAFKDAAAGKIDQAQFKAAQDKAIRDVVALQEQLGLKVVTDGEFRRSSYWGHWVTAIDGLDIAEALYPFHDDKGNEAKFITANVTGKLRKASPISTEEFKFLKSIAKAEPKITMPGPSTFHFWRGKASLTQSPYKTAEEFYADLTAIYRQEIADLAALGCRYIQFDEVALIMLGSDDARARCKALGDDPDHLTDLYIQAINDAARDRPKDMVAGLHICRGNFKGRWLTEGGYDAVAEKIFKRTNVDTFLLEYDSPRAGDFKPLKQVPAGKNVVLGLVSTKTPTLEQQAELEARIKEAAQYVPLDRLSISPQCGFASTAAGNPVTVEDEKKKLGLCLSVAEHVWHSH